MVSFNDLLFTVLRMTVVSEELYKLPSALVGDTEWGYTLMICICMYVCHAQVC